jgi:RNA polymerase sigma-70 factor, ECF subfamily
MKDGANRIRPKGDLLVVAERAKLPERAYEGLEHRPAALAPREVTHDPGPRARVEVVLHIAGQVVAGFAMGRDPRPQEDAQHVRLDARRHRFVSESYDLPVPPAEQTDSELVRQAQEGDVDAFAAIVQRHERRLRIVMLRILDDARDVEEAVQDTFVQAWRNLDRYRGEAALFTWLYRIGVNAALAGTRRKKGRLVGLEALDAEPAAHAEGMATPESATEAHDLRSRIVDALSELPFEQREAIVLRDVAGLSNEEVAEALGVSLPAAKSRIHRGRLQLRELLEPMEGE